MNKKCRKCQKEITTGNFYSFYCGEKGGKRIIEYDIKKRGDNFYCLVCTSKEKAEAPENIAFGNLLEIKWEVGNKIDEQILDFEEKWNKHKNSEFAKQDQDTSEKSILTYCQTSYQELEPYLQKSEIVGKSFGRKIEGCGKSSIQFYYLFDKSARNKNFRKEVVEPTIAKILGVEKLDQEINTTIKDSGPGVPGLADGKLKINDNVVNYRWTDGPMGGFFRRLSFEVFDPNFALQSFCRALKIKEKELKGKMPQKTPSNQPNAPQKKPTNWTNRILIVSLVIGGILVVAIAVRKLIFGGKKSLNN